MKRIISKLVLFVFIISLVTSCGAEPKSLENQQGQISNNDGYPYKIVDSLGREIEISAEPQRVISLVPNITEIIFSLGRGDRLVGRTEYCDYPEQVSGVTSVGDLFKPNFEEILALQPDLLIASTNLSPDSLAKLEELQIRTLIIAEENSFDGVYEAIEQIAKILRVEEEGETIISEMKAKIKSVTERVSGKEKPSVYYMVGYGKTGDYTAGRDTFIGQLIEMAGGQNAASDTEQWQYSLEKLLEKDPDLIICPLGAGYKEELPQANGYKELTAVREGRVYEINADLIERHGPRLAEGLQELAEIIHPASLRR